jgi:DinB family protein
MSAPAYIEELRRTVADAAPRLLALGDSSRTPRAPGKWSPREIVGHLVDSACNNHQRFIRAQFQEDLVFGGYQQEDWVRAGAYHDAPWEDLVSLWRTFNLQIARVMEHVPDAIRLREASRHNFDQVGFRPLPPGQPATLDFLMEDYVRHLEHHLRQVFEVPQN